MTIRAVLFDFDGTLADSFAAITASTNHVRGIYGLPAIPESTVREHVGLGLANLMQTLAPQAETADAVAAYHAHHPSVMAAGTKLFPGVRETAHRSVLGPVRGRPVERCPLVLLLRHCRGPGTGEGLLLVQLLPRRR